MKNSGFTLLETIIYCALFSVLMTSAIITVYALMATTASTKKQTSIIAEATFITQKLSWVFTNATSIEVINADTIIITRPDLLLHSPLTLEFKDNSIYLERGTFGSHLLVSPHFDVSLQSLSYVNAIVKINYSIDTTEFRFEAIIP